MFYVLQSNSLVKDEEMDDDCERGMFRAYNIFTCLSSYKAISSGHLGMEKGMKHLYMIIN